MLLNYFYPDLLSKWKVKNVGTFYRNYNRDVMSLDADAGKVSLARDGFLRLLPDALISDPGELRGKGFDARYEQMKLRRQILTEAFSPIDTFHFRTSLAIEREVSELLDTKLAYILKQHFDYDIEAETSPKVREIATMLPFISQKRGDVYFVAELLSIIYGCDVETDLSHRYSDTDSTKAWMPMVRYNIILKGMNAAQYKSESEQLEAVRQFVAEWFIPFDVMCRIEFKQHGIRPTTDGILVLGYNTEL